MHLNHSETTPPPTPPRFMEKLTSKFLASAKKFLGTTTLSHPSFPGMTSEEGRYSRPLPLDQV